MNTYKLAYNEDLIHKVTIQAETLEDAQKVVDALQNGEIDIEDIQKLEGSNVSTERMHSEIVTADEGLSYF